MSIAQATPETELRPSASWSRAISATTPVDVFRTFLETTQQVLRQPLAELNSLDHLQSFLVTGDGQYRHSSAVLESKPEWADAEYRQAYAQAAVEQGIAWQVRVNRERRNLTQAELALRIGTRQSAISRMEDPEYGAHSLQQLVKVAHAFDCALLVKFVSFATLACESEHLSPDDLYAASYMEDIGATNE